MNFPTDPAPGLGRMMVFVDGENIVGRFQAMLAEGRNLHDNVSYEKDIYVWKDRAVRSGPNIILRATYYTYVVGSEEKLTEISKRIKGLTFSQYEIHGQTQHFPNNLTPKVFRKPKNARQGKGVDIQMTVDILTNVYQNNLDTVYLVSGDGDYKPVIEEAIRCGKQVYIAALSSGLNRDLPLIADTFISLDHQFFKPE